MQRGEIWLINLDPTIGAEIKKTRPAVIVSDDAIGILPLSHRLSHRPSIPHADDLGPRDVGIPLLGCARHLACSLAYQFD